MADTSFSTSHALRVSKFSAALFKYFLFDRFFTKFTGKVDMHRGVLVSTDENSLVQIKADFSKGKGDRIVYPLTTPLSGAGIVGDGAIETYEEALSAYAFEMTLKQVANAVRTEGRLSDLRVAFDVRQVATQSLGTWMGRRIDHYTHMALSGLASVDANISAVTPTSTRRWCGGQTTAGVVTAATGNLDAGINATAANSLFGTKVISLVKRKATASEPIIAPLNVNGQDYYVMFIHPYQFKALQQEDAWINAQRDANIKGEKNPLFSGAAGVWDGVIIHVDPWVEVRYGEGGTTASEVFEAGDGCPSGLYVARALFCGKQAVVQAFGRMPELKEKLFEYDTVWGVATIAQVIVGCPKFNSVEVGKLCVDTAYVAD